MKQFLSIICLLVILMLSGCPNTNNEEYTLLSCSYYQESETYQDFEEADQHFPKNCNGSFVVSNMNNPPIGCDAGKSTHCKPPIISISENLSIDNIILNLYTTDPNGININLYDGNEILINDLSCEIFSYNEESGLAQLKINDTRFVIDPSYIVAFEVPRKIRNKSLEDKLKVRFELKQ